ncbi:MAG: tetratricopeptide repeat protein [Candidatus Krumholzibacteriota bacterium]|nr:tetratricopeptide repeat protein [Candidatus Krumholzibacteriota bacterium]
MSRASKLRRQAQDLLKKGKLQKAINVYKKILDGHSSNPNLLNELGDIYIKTGDRIQAISSFENAINHYEKVALYNNAVAVCKKILKIIPGRLSTVYKLGELKAKQNFTSEAAEYFNSYMDLLLSESDSLPEGTDQRIETILELMGNYQRVISKSVDVFETLGNSFRASEINAQLIRDNNERGTSESLEFYKERMERLKSSLSDREREKVDRILDSIKIDPSLKEDDAKTEIDMDSESSDLQSHKSDLNVKDDLETTMYKDREKEAAEGVQPEGLDTDDEMKGEGQSDEYVISSDNNYQSAENEFPESKDETKDEFSDSKREEKEKLDKRESAEPENSFEKIESGDSLEDFSDITEFRGKDETESHKEITSDIEEDDFKSHYDLGMAYIEMALFNEAIKELQVATRSQELKLRSLEMIGYCFIQKGQYNLAVKQLERGAEIADSYGDEDLGIYYNLGLAYEAIDDVEKARENFEKVYVIDVSFRDILEKMKKLNSHT